jgi:hypothetical protein
VNELLEELVLTRESFVTANHAFERAINAIRWNRINTIIQYALIILVFVLGWVGVMNYMNYRQQNCERSNEQRLTIQASMQQNAFAIGVALQTVFNAPDERFQEYLDAYNAQTPQEAFAIRECS